MSEEEDFYSGVRTSIRVARQMRGVTQGELASRCGIPRMVIGHIEVGNQKVSLYQIYLIASALDVKPGTLIAGNVRKSRKEI